ncbi:MAG: hypothetical protein ACRD22_09410, partial [Terriglobia bacterium]
MEKGGGTVDRLVQIGPILEGLGQSFPSRIWSGMFLNVNDRQPLRNAFERYQGHMLSALEMAHVQRELRAAFAAHGGLWRGARTARRPLRARFDAWVGIFASDAPISFLRSPALQALVRAMMAKPGGVGQEFCQHSFARERHLWQTAGTFRLERPLEPFDAGDAAML